MNSDLQAIYDKIQVYLRSKAITSPDPSKVLANDEAELFENVLVELEKAGQVDPTNFATYDPDTEYNSADPSFVSYTSAGKTNVYQYIYPTPATGIVPTNTSYWKIASSGEFNHIQNTDLGTSSETFIIQRNSQNQGIEGITAIEFETQQGGKVVAQGVHWYNDGAGDEWYDMKICYDYTGDILYDDWLGISMQGHTHDNASAGTSGFMTGSQWQKLKGLPVKNSEYFEVIVPPVFSVNTTTGILSASAGVIRDTDSGAEIIIPAKSDVYGGSYAAESGKYVFGTVTDVGGVWTTGVVVAGYGPLTLPDTLDTGLTVAYFGLYQISTYSSLVKEVPHAFVRKVRGRDGVYRPVTGSAVLDLAKNTIAYKTGTVVSFDLPETHYGSEAVPLTGNITASHTGAVVGHMAFMTHNNGTAPTFGSEFHKTAASGDYELGVNNYIYFDYRSATRINYSITQ